MTIFHAALLFVAVQRVVELLLAQSNTARLLRSGAFEVDRGGYKFIVVLHAAWLAALYVAVPAATLPHWPLLALFGALQVARIWVIASLGQRWTTRIIVLPDAPLVRRGAYRWLRHPNYLIVATEIAILPLAFSAIAIAIGFSACNGLLLVRRIRIEERALGMRSHHIQETQPRCNSL
ncbi:MAG TPA: isoprenylcysteine carboxylmethyltransferase family protein [Stellaceae bacterium]|nr:isoprenylcysteine carboxylmethyltransferase family protein [Stellaceae bacterium]